MSVSDSTAVSTTQRALTARSMSVSAVRRLGMCASLLLLVGSLGCGAMPGYDPVARTPVINALRHGEGPQIALTTVYIAVAVLSLAWLHLGRAIRRNEAGTSPNDLLRTGALWGAPLLIAMPLFSRDLYSYAAQAQLTHAGFNPYDHGPAALPGPFLDQVQRLWVDTPAPYGPLWLMLGSLIASVTTHHVLLTVWCMRWLAVVGILLTARYVPRLATSCGVDPRLTIWLALLNPLVLIHLVAGGHNDALMIGLMTAGLSVGINSSTTRGLARGAMLITLAALVKAPAMIALGFLIPVWAKREHGRWPQVSAGFKIAIVSLATFGGVTLTSGLGVGWINELNAAGAVRNWSSLPTGLAMLISEVGSAFGLDTDDSQLVERLRQCGLVISLVIVTTLWILALRKPERSMSYLGLSLLALIMLGPVVQPWYLLWPFTLFSAIALRWRYVLIIAGVSVGLSLIITPEGATLFLERSPVAATAAAAAIATYLVLGRNGRADRDRATSTQPTAQNNQGDHDREPGATARARWSTHRTGERTGLD